MGSSLKRDVRSLKSVLREVYKTSCGTDRALDLAALTTRLQVLEGYSVEAVAETVSLLISSGCLEHKLYGINTPVADAPDGKGHFSRGHSILRCTERGLVLLGICTDAHINQLCDIETDQEAVHQILVWTHREETENHS